MDVLLKLHDVTHKSVKAINPDIKVLGGGTHTWDFDFVERFLAGGGGDFCDGVSLHGYTYSPHLYVDYFDRIDALFEKYNLPADFKAYITEIGFRTPAFSDADQALWLSLFTMEAASRERVGSLLWFRYFNPKPEDLSRYHQRASNGYSLVGYEGAYCRPALGAYRFTHNVLQDCDEVQASGHADSRRYLFKRDGVTVLKGLFEMDWTEDKIAALPVTTAQTIYGGIVKTEDLVGTKALIFH